MTHSRRHIVLFLLLSFGAAAALAQCPAGTWVTLAPLNDPRQELAAAQLDGKIYAVAGLAGSATANEIYDPVSDHWIFGADYPTPTDHAWAVAFEGLLYVGGGRSNRVFSYDPAADSWTELASSAFFHGGTPAAAVLGNRIVVAGGTGGGMAGNEVEAYDSVSDGWTPLASMTCARNHLAAAAIGGKLYVAGGRPASQTCHEVYDPVANTWTMKAPMPTGRSGLTGAAVGGCFYTFGGEGNAADPNGIFHNVEAYDPTTDEWFELPPMQTGRHGIYAAVLGNVIYLPGGATSEGLGVTGVNEAYVIGTVEPREPVTLSSGPRGAPRVIERE